MHCKNNFLLPLSGQEKKLFFKFFSEAKDFERWKIAGVKIVGFFVSFVNKSFVQSYSFYNNSPGLLLVFKHFPAKKKLDSEACQQKFKATSWNMGFSEIDHNYDLMN